MPAQSKPYDDRELQLLNDIADQDELGLRRQTRLKSAGNNFNRLNAILVVGTIVAGLIAGSAAIPNKGSWHWVAVVAGFLAAALGGITKAFDIAKKARVKWLVYNRYGRWRGGLRRLRRDVGYIDYERADVRFTELENERRQIEEIERTEVEPQDQGGPTAALARAPSQ